MSSGNLFGDAGSNTSSNIQAVGTSIIGRWEDDEVWTVPVTRGTASFVSYWNVRTWCLELYIIMTHTPSHDSCSRPHLQRKYHQCFLIVRVEAFTKGRIHAPRGVTGNQTRTSNISSWSSGYSTRSNMAPVTLRPAGWVFSCNPGHKCQQKRWTRTENGIFFQMRHWLASIPTVIEINLPSLIGM